jgi:hypothetical protein
MIFEDDVDWDIRIRSQLESFAIASQSLIVQGHSPLAFNRHHVVPNYEANETYSYLARSRGRVKSSVYSISLTPTLEQSRPFRHPLMESSGPALLQHEALVEVAGLGPVILPSSTIQSPYGDLASWDLLWLGHCGAGFPIPDSPTLPSSLFRLQDAVFDVRNDPTVPAPRHLRWAPPPGPADPVASMYPPHTRVYHRIGGGALCTTAYAVSQRGARRILERLGTRIDMAGFDSQLGVWCGQGADEVDPAAAAEESPKGGRPAARLRERICLTTQPPVFGMHKIAESDTGTGLADGPRTAKTRYIRLSVRKNLQSLLVADMDLVDQWPD